MSKEDPDLDCVTRCAAGDVEAFGILIERYQKPIFRAVMHMVGNYEDARELTQQVFLNAFEHLSSFDRGRKFFSWIYRIAMNESINHIKSRKSATSIDDTTADLVPRVDPFASLERSRAVRQAVQSLKPEYREVIVLRHFLDCSYHDAADVLSLPEKTVKSRLFTARQMLRDALAPASERRATRW